MKSIEAYFLREKKRLQFYRFVDIFCHALVLILLCSELFVLGRLFLSGFRGSRFWLTPLLVGFVGFSFVLVSLFLFLRKKSLKPISLSEVGEAIEKQSKGFNLKKSKGELRAVGFFLEHPAPQAESEDFRLAHIQFWNRRIQKYICRVKPSLRLQILFFFAVMGGLSFFAIKSRLTHSLPTTVIEWTPRSFEFQQPYQGAPWQTESGALTGIQGSLVRFEAPRFGILQTFLYIKESGASWLMIPCEGLCSWRLRERGQYAVGSLFFRSSLFPLQVIADEPPRGVLFAKVGQDYVPSAALQAINTESLMLQASASDDVRLSKVELHHRSPETTESEKVMEWSVNDRHFKKEFSMKLSGWKGGQHQVFLRMYDEFKFADSSPVSVLFADEETLRAKRLSDMNALIEEWVHILSDLLESNEDHRLSTQLVKRIESIQYPDPGESPGLIGFVKELQMLGQRILRWAKFSPDFSAAKDLIQRSEKAILYGLSLVFQEKTGEIEATSNALKSSQNELSDLLEKIKKGELEGSSQELQEAFEKLAKQIEEMQKKIRDLPSGPNDDLLNRESLEAEMDESQDLAKRIEEIKKQMASGDNKGALRELESLMNQLSILSKEMERSLDQWKSNLDKGSMESAKRFAQKLEELRKREESLTEKTEALKERAQQLEEQNAKTWKPIQPEKLELLQRDFNGLKKEQEQLGNDFKSATENFDKDMQGSEWESMLRSEDAKELERQISERMMNARDSLKERKGFDAVSNEKEAVELMKKAMESQKKMQKQLQTLGQSSAEGKKTGERVEILANENKSEKERRRKILDSMQRKVEDRFQKSHEQYFEELLQR